MHIIKLDAIGSTNTFLRQISSAEALKDFTVVVADHQTEGRGQMGAKWSVQSGKNLTFSVFKEVAFLDLENHFHISMVISLAIHSVLISLKIPKVRIKWPNDILAGNKKICGILIENVIKNNKANASIIGIGLNVNQTDFDGLPNASSLLKLTGHVYDKDELMNAILDALKINFKRLKEGDFAEIKKDYEELLYRRDKPSTFKDHNGNLFSGFIKGVSSEGKLRLLLVDAVIKDYDLKEIQLLY